MQRFLIFYGSENDAWLCWADDVNHAREQFDNAKLGGEINDIYFLVIASNENESI